MSTFLQYQLGQALGDLGAGDASPGAAGGGAASGFGMALGFVMPQLIGRSLVGRGWPPHACFRTTGPHGFLGQHRFCGHCGASLVPGGRFCGHCGTATGR